MAAEGPISEGSKTSKGAGCGVAFGLLFALIGLGVLALAMVTAMNAWKAQSWTQTPCKILTAEITESNDDDGTSYSADFTYAYEFEGVNHVGDRDGIIGFSGSRSYAKDRLRSLPVGTETHCWVDPNEPASAVLDASFPSWVIGGLSAFGFLFSLVGGSVAYFSVRAIRAANRRQAMASDSLASEDPHFQTDVIDRDADSSQPPTMKLASASREKVRGHGETDVHPADAIDRKADQPQRLKAESSRLMRLIGVTFLALFWNGLISFMGFGVFNDGPGGLMNWGLGLFFIPFVLVGLFLIAAVIHTFVSLFNPRIIIALSTGAVARGGDVDVAWEVSGGIRSIDRLRISVVGTEWARYQRGTSTVVDESTFEVVPVVSTEESSELQFGSASVTVPPEAMHTLDQTNNKIKWAVVVKGEIRWWPNVTGNYPFRVMPGLKITEANDDFIKGSKT